MTTFRPVASLRELVEWPRPEGTQPSAALVGSIARLGIQNPIVGYVENGCFIVTQGVLRYRAAVKLGITDVPVDVKPKEEALARRFGI